MPTQQPVAEPLDTQQLLRVLTALKKGDFAARLPLDWTGVRGKIADALNDIIELHEKMARECVRVSHAVGKEGKITQRLGLGAVDGSWATLVEAVNTLIADLGRPSNEMARVIGAVANGDLSPRIALEVDGMPLEGQFLHTARTVNTMVDQLSSFASEVTRVAREVGTEGKLGGQADVKGVAGTWKDLTDSVNMMASNLTGQVRNIAEVATAVANGDLSKKITVAMQGEILELKDTINVMVDQLNSFASEVTRVAREVGIEGELGGQAHVPGVAGTWKDLTDNVNMMANNLTGQVRNIAEVTTAVANGNLSKKITVVVRGEILELKNTINTMVDQLNSFASEVTRVAREVGTEGELGGQAQVKGVSGTWKDLTDSVNMMAVNLTSQVRGIAKVVTGVANGDLKQKLTVEAKGEIAALTYTINSMIDTLATFADQVTSVAREVGVEGQLGGQASVPGAAGIWKDLTDNVNQLAANLTTQMRAIAEVATAVTKGDLTRSIRVEASGEVAVLKDNINEMIRNLRDTTQKNSEQDWLKTNLTKFTRLLPGQKDLLSVARLILSELAPLVAAQHGIFYLMNNSNGTPRLRLLATYAYKERKGLSSEFALGEGLVGQCALEKERILITDVPSDYVQISSGLGHATPLSIMVLPVLFEGEVKAVIELASFQRYSAIHQAFLEQLTESIGIVLNTIEANVRTQELLKQSQSLAHELQSRQEELQQTNRELQDNARLLAQQNAEVERKNSEVEQAKLELEEQASQLGLTSKYKSEFLANMSHELRTPLNSLLLLARQLSDNPNGNLLPKQVEFAHAIYASGTELLMLINDILDLAKIESGTVSLYMHGIALRDLCDDLERTFRLIADTKGLGFTITLDAHLPQYLQTDATRLLQILKNLLSNAFKFTDQGQVALQITLATTGWSAHLDTLNNADMVVAFAVSDTGMGIPPDKQRLIFEAFQQADGTTSRKYGGTGLGLSISREIARLFGGEIQLQSAMDQGSTFTFYLPQPAPSTSSWSQWPRAGEQLDAALPAPSRTVWAPLALRAQSEGIRDDREQIQPGDRVVLMVENDVNFAQVLLEIVHEIAWKGIVTSQGASACALARQFKPAAITLDLLLPDIEGWTVLQLLQRDPDTRHIPVHVITVMDEERERGRQPGVTSYLVKPVSKQAIHEALAAPKASDPQWPGPHGRSLTPGDTLLAGKKVLLVDDDVRNLFALTSILETQHMEILAAESGQTGIDLLQNAADVAVVLMDVMMPGMDGYDTIRAIRSVPRFSHLPIIAVTAKAMPGDREKCLEAGASDYLAKPVDTEQLLARLRAAVAGR